MESEAKIVRLIFDLYLQGKTINAICRHLTEKGIPTPEGKEKWGVPTVNSILQNEKYCGNALLQKRYVANYLTKAIRCNNGEIPQFFVQGSHPGIVSEAVFNLVHEEMAKNRELGKSAAPVKSSPPWFSAVIRIVTGYSVERHGDRTLLTAAGSGSAMRNIGSRATSAAIRLL